MASVPYTISFTTNKTDYDLLTDDNILDVLENVFNCSKQTIEKGNLIVDFIIKTETPTRVRFKTEKPWSSFINDKIYTSGGYITGVKNIFIEDEGVNGEITFRIQ